MKRTAVLVLAGLLLACTVLAFAGEEKKKAEDPAAELAKSVKNGKMLFGDKSLGTNEMSCSSCHMEGGTKDNKMGETAIPAFNNLAAKYPKYMASAKKVMTLDQVNNLCIVAAMKGKALSWDDQRLADLTAYVASVKKEAKEVKEVKKPVEPTEPTEPEEPTEENE